MIVDFKFAKTIMSKKGYRLAVSTYFDCGKNRELFIKVMEKKKEEQRKKYIEEFGLEQQTLL